MYQFKQVISAKKKSQLHYESNNVDRPSAGPECPLIWGEPGTFDTMANVMSPNIKEKVKNIESSSSKRNNSIIEL